MTNQTKNSMLLMLCALIWGTAFVAQSAGSGMGAFSFLAGRSWMAVLVLIPTVKAFDALHHRQGRPDGKPKTAAERKLLLKAGLVCGTLLFLASAAQQLGITLDPSTAKAGFLTAMYVVLVPVFGLFLGRKGSAQLWVSMAIAVVGLYLLCMKDGFGSIQSSDGLLLLCAVLFSFQIMAVDHFSPQMDGVRLSLVEFFVVSVESTVAALLFEQPAMAEFVTFAGPILYCGVMSSGVAYTLQILGQRDLNPAIASLIMCLESVFSAMGGWLHAAPEPLRRGNASAACCSLPPWCWRSCPWARLMRSKPPDSMAGKTRAPSCAAPTASSMSCSRKVKKLNLRVRSNGSVAVSIPLTAMDWSQADRFVPQHAQWIRLRPGEEYHEAEHGKRRSAA